MTPTGIDSALDLLVARSTGTAGGAGSDATDVHEAASYIRSTIRDLEVMQGELTDALIASHDRILAMKALATMNVQGVASDQTVAMLLQHARDLTRSNLVILFHGTSVADTAGDTSDLAAHTEVALRSIAETRGALFRTAAADSAMIATLDPDGRAERYAAFVRTSDAPFSTSDLPLVEAVVAALGVMLAFTELHQRELEQAAVEREHQLASALAQSVIADRPPRSAGIDLFARTVPASLTGGDFYVFGQTDGSTWFAVGDVAGKGLPAAMVMTRAVSACRVAFLAHRDASVGDVFARIEAELFEHLDDAGVFITLAVGTVADETRIVSLVNAGHSPVIHVHDTATHAVTESIAASVPPLGVIRGRVPTISTFTLEHDDCLIIGSDGLAEQSDPDGEMFGYDRFRDLCMLAPTMSAERFGSAVFETIEAFADGEDASDDSTLVVVTAATGRV